MHHNQEYQVLIRNTIKKSVYKSIKRTIASDVTESLFDAIIQIEEELHTIKTKVPNWNTTLRQQLVTNTIGILLSNELTIEELLENGLEIGQAALLELTLNDMR